MARHGSLWRTVAWHAWHVARSRLQPRIGTGRGILTGGQSAEHRGHATDFLVIDCSFVCRSKTPTGHSLVIDCSFACRPKTPTGHAQRPDLHGVPRRSSATAPAAGFPANAMHHTPSHSEYAHGKEGTYCTVQGQTRLSGAPSSSVLTSWVMEDRIGAPTTPVLYYDEELRGSRFGRAVSSHLKPQA